MPLVLLDFDGTITESDSLNSLVHSAISHSPSLSLESKTWTSIVKAWLSDHESHVAAYSPPGESRLTPEAELSFLESLKPLERASVERVEKAGFFEGLNEEIMEELGREAVKSGDVKVREGFRELVKEIGQREWEVGVVSVNWSRGWVRGVMDVEVDGAVINSIGEDGKIRGPDVEGFEKERMVLTAGDKLEATKVLVKEKGGGKWMYLGDSTTDMACLLEADVGVVVAQGERSKLLQTLRRLGFEVRRVREGRAGLVWARDFEEVLKGGVLDWLRD
ncbi:HAD-like domain-containing protein [Immersiella caudata]|uniref:HAD-like domain-containing protein n=1 Tax=Immersiella caudata TaxID=314043 RepID=A0AA40CBE4_9PEZI|nr:HAD-like domain-containing protein [Immersiella caudata]